MSAASELSRLRQQAVRLRSDIGKASATVAAKRKKAADARIAAGRTTSATTQRSKFREAETAEKAANDAETKRANLEKRLADTEGRVLKAQGRHDKEQRAHQEKALDAIEKRATQAAQQFVGPPFERAVGVEDQHDLGADAGAAPEYDVFLSHASEDKDDFARPLQEALAARGIVVWFDEINIKVGQSIRQEIERGIARARFGVVVISPDFFAKQWTQAELDALFGKKTTSGKNLILPVWHRVTKDQVQAQSPLLGGILALNSSVMGIEEIADAIAEVVQR